jgi:hypothetical protein
MRELGSIDRRRVLAVAAALEMGAGLALALAPAPVVSLLFGAELPVMAWPLGRLAGIALLSFGLACWPARPPAEDRSTLRAMLVYNSLVALYLGVLGSVAGGGPLLWPAAVFHALVAVLLVWTGRAARGAAGGR